MKKYTVLLLSMALLLAGGSVSANKVYPKSEGFQPELILLPSDHYTVGYCTLNKNPAWVYYQVHSGVEIASGERPGYFVMDHRVPDPVSSDDYTNSGYDRGHMAPNHIMGRVGGPEAQEATFVMTNVIPQDPELNRGPWKMLEMLIANTYLEEFEFMYIFTGPVYDFNPHREKRTLKSGVRIPDGCYKIIVDLDGFEFRVLAFLFPNEGPYTELKDYLVSVDCIERATGLDFLSDLPDVIENTLESERPTSLWTTNHDTDEIPGN